MGVLALGLGDRLVWRRRPGIAQRLVGNTLGDIPAATGNLARRAVGAPADAETLSQAGPSRHGGLV